MPRSSAATTDLLLALLDQCYNRTSWHGPNLCASFRGLTPAQAYWRTAPGRHNIAEQVLHTAYWKYAVVRRLRGQKRGSFPLKGSNWFPVTQTPSHAEWAQMAANLDDQHQQLRAAVADLPPGRLLAAAPGGRESAKKRITNWALISGIAAHDVYHAGQIRLLRALQGAEAS